MFQHKALCHIHQQVPNNIVAGVISDALATKKVR